LKEGKKPEHLFVYFKTTPTATTQFTKAYINVIELRERIEQEQQIYTQFDSTDQLILKLESQIQKITL